MIKHIFTAIAVITFGIANAQKAQFGLKGGINVANQNFSVEGGFPTPSSIIGFHIGGFVEIKMSDKFAIQPEILYSTQGSKFDMTIYDSGFEYYTKNTFKLGYINIPVMFKYYAAKKIALEAGPQIGFLTSSKIETAVFGESVTQNAKDLFETIDFGLIFGAGFDITNKLSAGIRYNVGLANIAKTDGNSDESIKNNVFSVSLGYKF